MKPSDVRVWHREGISTPQQPSSRTPQPTSSPLRGSPTPAKPRFRLSWQLLAFFLALLVINVWFGSKATQAPTRIRVPYSPFFLNQVSHGHVTSITSKGTAIQGDVHARRGIRGLEGDDALRDRDPRLRQHRRALGAAAEARTSSSTRSRSRRSGPVVGGPARSSFGPTLLFLGTAVLADAPGGQRAGDARRVRPLACAALRALGRARSRSPTSPGSTRRRPSSREVVDFLRQPEKYLKLGGADPARRAAERPARHRQDAARARGRRRGRTCRSSRCRPRSSSRRSSGSAPRACAICSSRRRPRRRRSSSSTSSTRSAARAPRASPGSAAATTSASRRSTRS